VGDTPCFALTELSLSHDSICHRLDALLCVVLHTIDSATDGVGFHQSGIVGFQQRLEVADGGGGTKPAIIVLPIMYVLSRRKLVLAEKLQSRALRTDAIENITCGWLAFVVIAALVAQWAIGEWWIDPLASLVVVGFLIREGREAWTGDECCGHT
jgi:divalent metal cation (Fe/Co/Zn/Cd) transporter